MLQRDTQNQRLYLHDAVEQSEIESLTTDAEHLITTGSNIKSEELYTTTILRNALKVKAQNANPTSNPDIRYSVRNEFTKAVASLDSESQEIVNSAKRRRTYADHGLATMTEKRFNKALKEVSNNGGYFAFINPYDFLTLTTSSATRFLANNPNIVIARQ